MARSLRTLLRLLPTMLFQLLLQLAINQKINCKAAELVDSDLTPGFTRFTTGGTGPHQYLHGASTGRAYGPDYPAVYRHDHLPNKPWLQLWIGSRPGAPATDLASYAALSRDVAAEPFWGRRVRFRAVVGRRYLRSSNRELGYAALFVRVQSARGATLAMDNMWNRPITSFQQRFDVYEIVIDVPGPPPLDSCPWPGDGSTGGEAAELPAVIQIGALLCGGGKGEMYFGQATLSAVSEDEAPVVTGGPGPWFGPPWNEPLV